MAASPKRNVFAALGWVVWKGLANVGVPLAKRKISQRRSR